MFFAYFSHKFSTAELSRFISVHLYYGSNISRHYCNIGNFLWMISIAEVLNFRYKFVKIFNFTEIDSLPVFGKNTKERKQEVPTP
jgi:hypothetical protein